MSIFFLKKRTKKRALPSHPKIGDLNFPNAKEKTPSKNQRFSSAPPCRLSLRSHDLTKVMRKNLADFYPNFLHSVPETSHNQMLCLIEFEF